MNHLYCVRYKSKSADGENQEKRFFLFAEGVLKAEARFLKVTEYRRSNIIDVRKVQE